MKYLDYKKAKETEINDLPIKWAFGMKQFREMMAEWGLTENDTDKIFSLGAGGYFLKEDEPIIKAYFTKSSELPKLMRDKEFAIEAFTYEMQNHEYQINWQGDWDVCSCFSTKELKYEDSKTYKEYLAEAKYPKYVIEYYTKAKREYMKLVEKNNWY